MRKHRKKIISLLVVLMILLGLVWARHAIISHALHLTLSESSGNRITMKVDSVYYGFFSNTLLLDGCTLSFRNLHLDNDEHVTIDSLRLESLRLKGLSAWHLFWGKKIRARELELISPQLSVTTLDTAIQKKEAFDPSALWNKLKNHPALFGDLDASIKTVIIRNGRFDMEHDTDEGSTRLSLGYTITIHKFTSMASGAGAGPWPWFGSLEVRIDPFRFEHAGGEVVEADSLHLLSSDGILAVHGVRWIPDAGEHNPGAISGDIGSLEINLPEPLFDAMGFNRHIQRISLRDIDLSMSEQEDKGHGGSPIVRSLLPLTIDTIGIQRADILQRTSTGDTLVSSHIIGLQVLDLEADSSPAEGAAAWRSRDLSMDIGLTAVRLPEHHVVVDLNGLVYEETEGTLTIRDLKVNARPGSSVKLQCDTLQLKGLCLATPERYHPRELKLLLAGPRMDLRMQPEDSPKVSSSASVKPFSLAGLNIRRGSLYLETAHGQRVTAEDLMISADSLENLNDPKELLFGHLLVLTGSSAFSIPDKGIDVRYGQMKLTNDSLHLRALHLDAPSMAITTASLVLLNPDWISMARHQQFRGQSLDLYQPDLRITIAKKQEDKNAGHNQNEGSFPVVDLTDGIRLLDGQLDFQWEQNEEALRLTTGLKLTTGGIHLDRAPDSLWLMSLPWELELDQAVLDHNRGTVQLEDFRIAGPVGNTHLTALDWQDKQTGPAGSALPRLTIGRLDIDSLNIPALVRDHRLELGTLLLEGATVVLEHHQTSDSAPAKAPAVSLDIRSLPLSFREMQFKEVDVEILHVKNDHTMQIALGEADLRLTNWHVPSTNLLDHLQLNMATLAISDDAGAMNLALHDFRLDPVVHSLSIQGLHFKHSKESVSTDTLSSVDVTLAALEVSDMHIDKTFPGGFRARSLHLVNPEVDLLMPATTPVHEQKETTGVYHLPHWLSSMGIDTITFRDLAVSHRQPGMKKPARIHDLYVSLDGIRVDTSGVDVNDMNFIESTRIELGNNRWVSSDSLYVTSLKSVDYQFGTNQLTLDSLRMVPLYDDSLFFEKAVYQTDRINLFVGCMIAGQVRLRSLLHSGILHLGSLDVYGLDARLYRDKRYPMNPDAFKKMPQQMLRDMSRTLTIDSLITHDGQIHYKERVEKAPEPGHLFFDHFNMKAWHLTNDPAGLAADSMATINLDARLMGKADVKLLLFLNLVSPVDAWHLTGHTSSLQFADLNPITRNLVGVDMEGGEGRLLIPQIRGDSAVATGSVLFLYHRLKVGLYNREKATATTGFARGMANVLLNDLFIRSNNPTLLGKPKEGIVYFDRVTQKSFVYNMWKSVLSGMMSTFGINSREQRREKRAMSDWQ